MLSKFWARAWRGLASVKGNREEQLLKNVLISQYEQLSREIEDTKLSSALSYQEFRNNPFSKERVIIEQTNDTALRNIFSLQNLKLLGTKEGSELTKLQQELSAQLKDQFNTPNSTPSPPNPQHTQPKSSNEPTSNPAYFTDEDKEVISRLGTHSDTNIHEADISTLRQLVQDKQTELDALKSNHPTTNNDSEESNIETPTNTTREHIDKDAGINTDADNTLDAMSSLVEQIRNYNAMKAAGVAPDELPKIDFSRVPTSILKQLRQLHQQSRSANPKNQDSDK